MTKYRKNTPYTDPFRRCKNIALSTGIWRGGWIETIIFLESNINHEYNNGLHCREMYVSLWSCMYNIERLKKAKISELRRLRYREVCYTLSQMIEVFATWNQVSRTATGGLT